MPFSLLPRFHHQISGKVTIRSVCIVSGEYLVVGLDDGCIGVHGIAGDRAGTHSLTEKANKDHSEVSISGCSGNLQYHDSIMSAE